MLISALCDYYDILAAEGKVLPQGYSNVRLHYLVGLRADGSIAELVDYRSYTTVEKKKGKPQQVAAPRNVMMPKRTEKPGIDANIAEHRPLYLFGLNYEEAGFTPEDRTDKAKKSHEAFVEKNLRFLENLHSPIIDAYRNFVENWVPENERENPFLRQLGKAYATAGFAFCPAGRPDLLLHEDPVLKAAWESALQQTAETAPAGNLVQCAITGEWAPSVLIHDKIKGFPGGSSMGNALISFNSSAVESYGKSQSQNSNISEKAMRKYTEALNLLVTDPAHRTMLDDVVVVHWAMSDSDIYDKLVEKGVFQGFEDDDEGMNADETAALLKSILTEAKEAAISEKRLDVSAYIDPNVTFYMVGLKPNSARLAPVFICQNRFGALFQNIAQHQKDMQMSENARLIPLWRIKKELIKPFSKSDAVDPALLNQLMESVCNGYAYPIGLLATIVRRIKADSDTEENGYIKLNPLRVGIVKAYLNRKARVSGQEEEFSMALDTENQNPAYLCGRMFAVLEKLQQDAAGGNLNRTIKDAYFSSACSTPAVVFPKLLTLAQHHIPKAAYGGYWNYLLGEITQKLEGEFPKTLPLDEQGKFILGYYQQYWAKKEKSNIEKIETVEE